MRMENGQDMQPETSEQGTAGTLYVSNVPNLRASHFLIHANPDLITPEKCGQEFSRLVEAGKDFPMNLEVMAGVSSFGFQGREHRDSFMRAVFGMGSPEHEHREDFNVRNPSHVQRWGEMILSLAVRHSFNSTVDIYPGQKSVVIGFWNRNDREKFREVAPVIIPPPL